MKSGTRRVYLDTNVFIAAFEKVGAHADHARWILLAIESKEIEAVTSELTLSEVLVKTIDLGDAALTEAYKSMLTSSDAFEVVPISRPLLIAAAELRAGRRGLKLPDALHVATALSRDCAVLITDDRRMPLPEGLQQVDVSPFTLDDILRPQG